MVFMLTGLEFWDLNLSGDGACAIEEGPFVEPDTIGRALEGLGVGVRADASRFGLWPDSSWKFLREPNEVNRGDHAGPFEYPNLGLRREHRKATTDEPEAP